MESVFAIDPSTEFLSALKNPNTRDHYQRHLSPFFEHLKLQGDLRSQVREFVKRAKSDPAWTTHQINQYTQAQKERSERVEIPESTLANYWKPIAVLTDESDTILTWKKLLKNSKGSLIC